ncbi:MAG: PilZ domain-containing protein [Gemmataceae bacterium]|nr:PilZ domain-containing protein [Gemmataceae bacterium]
MSPDPERRTLAREECVLVAACREFEEEGGYWPALVQDISPQGASLIVNHAVGVGDRLTLKVHHADRQQLVRRTFEIRHVLAHGDCAWIVGGVFDRELAAEDFDSLR